MGYEVTCACGTTIRANDEDRLVVRLEAHVKVAHPDIDGEISREQFVGIAQKGRLTPQTG